MKKVIEEFKERYSNLDLFNRPNDGNKLRDDVYKKLNLYVDVKYLGTGTYMYNITNDFGKVVYNSKHYYQSVGAAQAQGLYRVLYLMQR